MAAVLVQEPVGAALGDGAEVGDGDGEEVQDVGDRGAVEVAVGLHPAVGQHDGVVDGRGQLALGDQAGVGHGVAAGTRDLRGAAHRVRVLDAGGVVLVVPGQARALEHGGHVGGAGGLPGVRADRVQLGGEHPVGAEQGLQGQRGGDVGGLIEGVEVGEGHDQHAEHAVGAVEEGEALLLAQLDRGDPVLGEQFAGRADGAVGALGVALAHEGERAVRQRGEVAGAAEGAVLVHDRGDPGVEHVGHGLRDLGAHPGVSGADGLQPQEHQRADHLALDARPHPGGVRADDVALELRPQAGADVPGRQGAEAGAHAVHGVRLGGQRVHDAAGRGEGRHRLLGKLDPGARARHGEDVGRGDPGRPHHHSVHIHIQERTQ